MDERYVEICGITEKEIHTYLEDELKEVADMQKMTYEETCRKLKDRYDGYHFVENSIGMYNPFSLLNTLRQIEEKGYALPFAGDDREVLKIGVNFSSETWNIEKWWVG